MKKMLFVLLIGAGFFISAGFSEGDKVPKTGVNLPFPEGQSYILIQGNNGKYGHVGKSAYSFDFKMATGTEVSAAFNGTVVKAVGNFENDNRTPGQENYIHIDHSDGTFSRYYHLMKDGLKVKEGDIVEAGDVIGLSGNTGASFAPHLHFDVTGECPEWGCLSIPITFSNVCEEMLEEDNPVTACNEDQ